MDYSKESPAILSLCPGMLGLERGLERAFVRLGWLAPKAVAYVEIEAFIIENLACSMEQGVVDAAPIWSNLKTFCPEPFRGKINLITGGYPCQPFSAVGRQKGFDDPRHLWPYIRKSIDIIRPDGCFFENVANHLNIGYETVRRELQELGYHVEEGLYSAIESGATHRRERLFILAIMDNSQCKGLERYEGTGSNQIRREDSIRSASKASVFPAKFGQNQLEWECERTVESKMGVTVNGYNFREDLLRMAGNGVVEQTAEIAFLDLLRKYYLTGLK